MRRQSGFAQVGGARLHYEVLGDGEPLVLIHAGTVHLPSMELPEDFNRIVLRFLDELLVGDGA